MLTKLPQLIDCLEKYIASTTPDTCYHDNNENIAATLSVAATQANIQDLTSAASDLNKAHEHLAHIEIKDQIYQ